MSPHSHSLRPSQWPTKTTMACLTILMIGSALQAMDARDASRGIKILGDLLINAAHDGNEDEVIRLVWADAPVNYANKKGATPLMHAAQNGHLGVVKVLLNHGALVNTQAKRLKNMSALCAATNKGHDQIVQLLLDKGAAVDLPLANGATPLIIASEKDHLKVVEILLKHGANVNAQEPGLENIFALGQAAEFGYSRIVKLLLTAISDTDAAAMRASYFALHCSMGRHGVKASKDVRGLVAHHFINALVQERMKRVPLMMALQDAHGDTAQNLALKYVNAEIANLLDLNNPESQKTIRTLIEANVREALKLPRPEPMEEESGGWLCTVQ